MMVVGPDMMLFLLLAKCVFVTRCMNYEGAIGDVAQQTVKSGQTTTFYGRLTHNGGRTL